MRQLTENALKLVKTDDAIFNISKAMIRDFRTVERWTRNRRNKQLTSPACVAVIAKVIGMPEDEIVEEATSTVSV